MKNTCRECRRCLNNDTVRHIEYDNDGVCNFCNNYDEVAEIFANSWIRNDCRFSGCEMETVKVHPDLGRTFCSVVILAVIFLCWLCRRWDESRECH